MWYKDNAYFRTHHLFLRIKWILRSRIASVCCILTFQHSSFVSLSAYHICTGKSFSEVLILASTNPQYDKRLSIELPVQCMKIPSSEHCQNMLCTQIVLNVKPKTKKQFVYKTCSECSEIGIFMYWTGNSMNNLLSYCGLVDAKIRASDIDFPVSAYPNT